jgi:hypothetical protein
MRWMRISTCRWRNCCVTCDCGIANVTTLARDIRVFDFYLHVWFFLFVRPVAVPALVRLKVLLFCGERSPMYWSVVRWWIGLPEVIPILLLRGY